jgi:hypothetical protein
MISLEQIRLLEAKISRAIELIRVLKEENAALRKGLDSAQRRMKELEGLVDGFKSDQHEIEAVILRTLKNLDELEDAAAAAARKPEAPRPAGPEPVEGLRGSSGAPVSPASGTSHPTPTAQVHPASAHGQPAPAPRPPAAGEDTSSKGELDIF